MIEATASTVFSAPKFYVGDEERQFSHFLRMSAEQLAGLQVKVTYIGEQRKALPTVIITADTVPDATIESRRLPVIGMRVPGIDFANDDLVPIHCGAPVEQLAALIRNLSALPVVINAMAAPNYDKLYSGYYLALSLYNRVDGAEHRLQAVVGQAEAKPLLEAVGQAVAATDSCRKALYLLWRGLGFHIGVLDPDTDGDGASDGREASWGTDPLCADTDGDGIGDAEEIMGGTDPRNVFNRLSRGRVLTVEAGEFRGSKVVELTTSPDLRSGQATMEIRFTPEAALPETENLVFLQVFRRTAVKTDGVVVPILPSLYIEYAGSPELDLHTLDGATVDHKVGELDPYYNGRDPQDQFIGAGDRQRAGFIRRDEVRATSMVYRCRTYEDHWRALNPEGVREVRFDQEVAAFCENGPGAGRFVGVLKWSWGKKRGEPLSAWIESTSSASGTTTGLVEVVADGRVTRVPVARLGDSGQPSRFYCDVLSLWLKNHKFALPGAVVSAGEGTSLTIPQPVAVSARVQVSTVDPPATDALLVSQGLRASRFARKACFTNFDGAELPWDYSPFALPLTVSFQYSAGDVHGLNERALGVGRVDSQTGGYTSEDLYVLGHDRHSRTITFCTRRSGTFVIVGKEAAGPAV